MVHLVIEVATFCQSLFFISSQHGRMHKTRINLNGRFSSYTPNNFAHLRAPSRRFGFYGILKTISCCNLFKKELILLLPVCCLGWQRRTCVCHLIKWFCRAKCGMMHEEHKSAHVHELLCPLHAFSCLVSVCAQVGSQAATSESYTLGQHDFNARCNASSHG